MAPTTDPTTLRDTLTIIGAVVGCVSCLGSVFWHVLNLRKERLDLRLRAEIGEEPDPLAGQRRRLDHRPVVYLVLENHGRREIFVRAIGARLNDGQTRIFGEGFPLVPALEGLPFSLKDGEATKVKCRLEVFGRASSVLPAEVAGLFAIDGRAKKWRLKGREFRKVREAARVHVDEKQDRMRAAMRADDLRFEQGKAAPKLPPASEPKS
jgi:hypothetical protein